MTQQELFQDVLPYYGFSRHAAVDFDTYNNQATVRVVEATGDKTIVRYTTSLPDADPAYVWAREEPLFTNLMTPAELARVISKEDAIAAGMIIDKP